MKSYKINYHRLQNLFQIKYYIVVIIIVCLLTFLIIISCFINVYQISSFYGIYNDNVLKIKINNKLSDILKNNQYIEYNNQKTTYKILQFGEYEIINNEIYQEVDMTIDGNFVNNEVGLVKFYYNKQKIIEYILELFK
ncbi:MAG: hypothetical protein E7161_02110 [Firmicutes bacterium]|nr:hypothetical protein [Bacillota bacterium]